MNAPTNCAVAVLSAVCLSFASPAAAACNETAAANVRSSSLDDKGKINMLRGIGCDASDLAAKADGDFKAGLELNRKLNEQRAEKEKADREKKARKAEDEMAKVVAEDNERREAFEQEMANRCGEYPLELKVGMSEKLLAMGCAGQADLVGEDKRARVYRIYGALVSVFNGKVVRWVRQ